MLQRFIVDGTCFRMSADLVDRQHHDLLFRLRPSHAASRVERGSRPVASIWSTPVSVTSIIDRPALKGVTVADETARRSAALAGSVELRNASLGWPSVQRRRSAGMAPLIASATPSAA